MSLDHALDAQVRDALEGTPDAEAWARTLRWRMRRYAVAQVIDVAVLLLSPWPALKVVTAIAFALYRARTVWTIIHARVHAPPLRPTPSLLFYDFCTGWIAIWWRRHHLTHHAHTNTARDPDTRLFAARDFTVPSPPRQGPSRLFRLAGVLVQYPFFYVLFFYRSLAAYRGRAWPFLLAMAAYGALLSVVLPPWEARLNTLANLGLGTLYIVFTFAPTHTAGPENFALTGDRRADQVLTTNDVWPRSRVWSWLCGGINQHVEHHLFPHVPSDHLGRVVPLVQAWAEARGLPYRSWSPLGLWWAHLRFLSGR